MYFYDYYYYCSLPSLTIICILSKRLIGSEYVTISMNNLHILTSSWEFKMMTELIPVTPANYLLSTSYFYGIVRWFYWLFSWELQSQMSSVKFSNPAVIRLLLPHPHPENQRIFLCSRQDRVLDRLNIEHFHMLVAHSSLQWLEQEFHTAHTQPELPLN